MVISDNTKKAFKELLGNLLRDVGVSILIRLAEEEDDEFDDDDDLF